MLYTGLGITAATITFEADTGQSCVLCPPKARDLKIIDEHRGKDVELTIQLIARLAEVPPAAIEGMCAQDYLVASKVVADFFASSPENGPLS